MVSGNYQSELIDLDRALDRVNDVVILPVSMWSSNMIINFSGCLCSRCGQANTKFRAVLYFRCGQANILWLLEAAFL